MSLPRSLAIAVLCGLMLMMLTLAAPVRAQQQSLGIAAVVNDEAISVYDLRNRLNLVIATSNLPNRPEVQQRILPQVLRNLIDERLKLQEARRLGIEVPDQEIDSRIEAIERRNNMPPGGMSNFLSNTGIDPATLRSQVRADLAWVDVIRQLYAPQVTISDREVDEAIADIEENAGKPEYRLSEIFLAIDDPANERDVAQLANRLVQQLREGASFGALAQNFSQTPTAAQGGDRGWVRANELDGALARTVSEMSPGEIAGPLRTEDGIYILLLRDRRTAPSLTGGERNEVKLTLRQLHLGVPGDAAPGDVADARDRASTLAGTAENCEQFKEVAAQSGTGMSGSLGTVELASLPAELRRNLADVGVNETTEPIRTADGVIIIMVCDREGDATAEDQLEQRRSRVRSGLMGDRLEVRARQHLRSLRRQAFIDIRL